MTGAVRRTDAESLGWHINISIYLSIARYSSPGLGRWSSSLPAQRSGTLCRKSHGSSPASLSGWKTRPSGHRLRLEFPRTHVQYCKPLINIESPAFFLISSTSLRGTDVMARFLVALLRVRVDKRFVSQLGKGRTSAELLWLVEQCVRGQITENSLSFDNKRLPSSKLKHHTVHYAPHAVRFW